MPVLSKSIRNKYEDEFKARFEKLLAAIQGRELKSPSEGVDRGVWINPETKCATVASAMEIRLLVEDFKGILAELKKLK